MGQVLVWAEEKKEFKYSQKKLNRVTEKNAKYKVAIGSFVGTVDIVGSPFNKIAEKEDSNSQTYNINVAFSNLEKPGVSQINSVTGLLSDFLKKTDKFDVVERNEVNQLIREIRFEKSGWTKKDPANELGNIYGVQYILLGEILPNYSGEQFGVAQYTTTLRLVDVNTGLVISTGTGQNDYLQESLKEAVKVISDSMKGSPWTCRVVRLDDKGVYINAGFVDNIKKNDIFSVIRLEDPVNNLTAGKILGYKQIEIAKIKVIDVLENDLSLAKPLVIKTPIKDGDIVLANRTILREDTETSLWNQIFGKTASNQ